jgi:8-oxo-dGTP diphosphatase
MMATLRAQRIASQWLLAQINRSARCVDECRASTPLSWRVGALDRISESKGWVGAAVILRNDKGEIMLLRRGATAPWMPGKWNLPGGTVDPGEAPNEAALREAREEVGVDVDPEKVHHVDSIEFPDGIAHFYEAETFRGEPKLNWENDKLDWVSPENLKDYDLVPGLERALSKSIESRSDSSSPTTETQGDISSGSSKGFRDFLSERYQNGRQKVRNPNVETGRDEISINYLLKRYPESSQAAELRREYEAWAQRRVAKMLRVPLRTVQGLFEHCRRTQAVRTAAAGRWVFSKEDSSYKQVLSEIMRQAVSTINQVCLETHGRTANLTELKAVFDLLLEDFKTPPQKSSRRWP